MIWLENWIMNDGSVFLGMIKMLAVIFLAIFLVIAVVGTVVNIVNPHQHAVLDLTTTWDCTETKVEMQWVRHGKIRHWEPVTVCDNYRRKER